MKGLPGKNSTDPIIESVKEALLAVDSEANIYVSVSGGVDSITLLHVFSLLRPQIKQTISVVHINHKLRGKESDDDQKLVKKLCRQYKIPLTVKTLKWGDCEKRNQALFRELRIKFFQKTVLSGKDRIFLAHHRDDQVETFLMRLMRGSGLHGLRCMVAQSGIYCRPFLKFSKSDLLAFALNHNLRWREDSTNRSNKYERNWIRNSLLPKLEKRRPGFSRRTALLIQEIQEQMPAVDPHHLPAIDFYQTGEGQDFIKVAGTNISNIFNTPTLRNRSRQEREQIAKLLSKKNEKLDITRSQLFLSCGILMISSRNQTAKKIKAKIPERDTLKTTLGSWTVLKKDEIEFITRINPFTKKNSLKKIFQKEKIPVFFRNEVPILKTVQEKFIPALPYHPSVQYKPSPLGVWFFKNKITPSEQKNIWAQSRSFETTKKDPPI